MISFNCRDVRIKSTFYADFRHAAHFVLFLVALDDMHDNTDNTDVDIRKNTTGHDQNT